MSEAQARRERMKQLALDNAEKAERLEHESSDLLARLGARVSKTSRWSADFLFQVDGDIYVRTLYGTGGQLIVVIHYEGREESGYVNLHRYARSFDEALIEIDRIAAVKSIYGH